MQQPTHADFEALAAIVRGLDNDADTRGEAGEFESLLAECADPDVLFYMSMQRLMRAKAQAGVLDLGGLVIMSSMDLDGLLGSIWLDAFLSGTRWGQRERI